MDEVDEVAHGDGPNTLSDEAYGDMMAEERPKQYDIDDEAYDKYIGAEVIMEVPGKGSRRETVRRCVEDLDGTKVGRIIRIHSWIIKSTSWNITTGPIIQRRRT